jgi:hypothetical protein
MIIGVNLQAGSSSGVNLMKKNHRPVDCKTGMPE